MPRHILIYFVTVFTVLLSACQDKYFEPGSASAVDQEGQPLVLKIIDAGLSARGSVKSRAAYDNEVSTRFEDGDTVGFFALSDEGKVMAKNIPYVYNENDGQWEYYEDMDHPEKHRVYYDAKMSTYIIYYPYTTDVDEVQTLEDLKNQEVFKCRLDQSDKDAFRFSDLMACEINVDVIDNKHEVSARLSHVRNCLMFDIETSWNVPNYGDMVYKTPLEALENFFFYIGTDDNKMVDIDNSGDEWVSPWANDSVNSPIPIEYAHRFEDGTYRYILPDTFEGPLRWNYTYHRHTYIDEWDVVTPEICMDEELGYTSTGSKCYFYQARHDMGDPTGDKMQPGDLFCVIDGNTEVGFPLPWETREILDEFSFRCIGLIVYLGRNPWDDTKYPAFGEDAEDDPGEDYGENPGDDYEENPGDDYEENPDDGYGENPGEDYGENKVNGYVISITYAGESVYPWLNINSNYFKNRTKANIAEVNRYCPRFLEDSRKGYWNGYYYNQIVKNNVEKYYEGSAFDVAGKYGTAENSDEWDDYLAAPKNSSGWFLPSIGFLEDNHEFIQGLLTERIPVLHDIITGWCEATNTDFGYEVNVNLEYPYSDHIQIKQMSTLYDFWCSCTESYQEVDPSFKRNGFSYYYHNKPDLSTSLSKCDRGHVRPVLVF